MINNKSYSIFDTDMHIFRNHPDRPVKNAARTVFESHRPTAMSAFSLLELKGNYIQDLILLRRKLWDSESFQNAIIRIDNSGTRKSRLMLLQLISILGGENFSINPWHEAKRQLITLLDAQIPVSWEEFRNGVDKILDDFKCTRASESPNDDDGTWRAPIPKCRKDNTQCEIIKFVGTYLRDLSSLETVLDEMSTTATDELSRIRKVVKSTIRTSEFPWEGSQCRSVGDLLIGLQTRAAGTHLITSNTREHRVLGDALQYSIIEFPIVDYRSK